MKKVLSLAVAIGMLSAILPQTMLTASAYTTKSTDEIVIYETDFEAEYDGDGLVWNENSASNATIGGWEKLSNAGIGDLHTTGRVATGNHVLFGGTDRNKNHCTQFYIPESMTFATGTYTFTFDYYHGDRTYNCWIGFNDKTSRDDGTEHECSLPTEFGCNTKNEWYSMEISIDVGNHVSNWTSYDSDGNEITSLSWDESSSAKLGALTAIRQISFETKNNNSTGTDGDYNFWLPGIDNLKITYTPVSAMTVAQGVSGNIYSNDFEDWNGVSENDNYATEGGWQFGNGENKRAGMSWGRYASKGFAAAFSPGVNNIIRDELNYSTYYLPPSKVVSTGIYKIGYDFYLGSKSGGDWIYIYATQDISGDADYERELHWNPVKALDQWYHCDLEIDVTNHTYDITIYYENGSQRYHDSGEYAADTVAAVRFASKGGGNLEGKYNNVCSYSSAIDNLEISNTTRQVTVVVTGETVTLDTGDVLDVSENLNFRSGTVDATNGSIKAGEKTITGGVVGFTESGKITLGAGNTAKIAVDNGDGTTSQGFMTGENAPSGKKTWTFRILGSVPGDPTDYDGNTFTVDIDFTNSEITGLANYGVSIFNIPKPLELRLETE